MISLGSLAVFTLATTFVLASPQVPHRKDALIGRQAATCNRDNLYRCFTASPAVASPYCATLITPATVSASAVTPSTSVTTTTTITVTETGQTVTTTTSTSTITETGIQTDVVTSTLPTTVTTTSTTSSTSATLLNKRAASSPACLTKDGAASTSYPVSRISSACSCLYRPTTTVTPTASAVTSTSTVTLMPTVTTIITSTVTVPTTSTSTTSTTTSVTTTTTTTSVSTLIVADPLVAFNRRAGPVTSAPACKYNRYNVYDYDAPGAAGADGQYTIGKDYCSSRCARDAKCKFFLYFVTAPYMANPGGAGRCILSYEPYDSRYHQCNIPYSGYSIGYERVIEQEGLQPVKMR